MGRELSRTEALARVPSKKSEAQKSREPLFEVERLNAAPFQKEPSTQVVLLGNWARPSDRRRGAVGLVWLFCAALKTFELFGKRSAHRKQ